MIRVTKSGGVVYVTFPVAKSFQEEWTEGDVYEKQYKEGNKVFFQYRFDEEKVKEIINEINKENVKIINQDIYWERQEGLYDKLIDKIKTKKKNIYINFIKDVWYNFYYGFYLFNTEGESDFSQAKSCGNMHIVIQKK